MSIFNNREKSKALSPKEELENKYKSSLSNLLLVIAFTVINIVLLVTNSNTYFLFSAFLPYFAVDYGKYLCGMYPQEYYEGDEIFFDSSFFVAMIAVAAVMLLLYLISWIFAKKKKVGWLIFALVVFVADTVAMFVLTEIGAESLVDIVFHGWVIVSLIMGVNAFNKMKKLPVEETAEQEQGVDENGEEIAENSSVLRLADTDVKSRTLVEGEYEGYHIEVRRVKRTNELVVDGKVYDEYEALAELAHTLRATIGGKRIEAGFDGTAKMFIYVDGKLVAKKTRLI